MCEFSVYDVVDPSKRIAEDIIKVTQEDGNLVIRKILGESLSLDNALVVDLDVTKERLMISRSPLIGNINKLVELTTNFNRNPTADLHRRILALWEKTKTDGDAAMKSLREK